MLVPPLGGASSQLLVLGGVEHPGMLEEPPCLESVSAVYQQGRLELGTLQRLHCLLQRGWEVRLPVHWVGPVDVSPHPCQPSHFLLGQSLLGGEPGSVPVGDAHAGVDVLMGVMLHILVDLIQPGVPVGFLLGQGPDKDHSRRWVAPQRRQKFSGSFHVPLSCASVFSSLPDRGLSPSGRWRCSRQTILQARRLALKRPWRHRFSSSGFSIRRSFPTQSVSCITLSLACSAACSARSNRSRVLEMWDSKFSGVGRRPRRMAFSNVGLISK